MARLVKTLDPLDRLEVAPYQDPAVLARAGLRREQGEAAAWLLHPDGHRYRGAAAVWAAIAVLFPVVGALPLALYHVPGIRLINDTLYRFVATNRGRFPSGPPLLEEGESPDGPSPSG